MGSRLTITARPENRFMWAKSEWRVLKLKEAHRSGDEMKSRAITVNQVSILTEQR